MAEEELGLTDEELSAIAETSLQDGNVLVNGRKKDVEIVSHDLASEDSSLGFNHAAIDMVIAFCSTAADGSHTCA